LTDRSAILHYLLTRGRVPYLIVLIGLTIVLAFFVSRLRIEQEPESMVSRQADRLAVYENFRDQFGNDEDLLLSITHRQLLQPTGLAVVHDLTQRVAAIDGVRQVLSLSNARQLVAGPYGAVDIPLVPNSVGSADFTEELRVSLQRNPQYQGLLISTDQQTAGLVIELEDRREDAALRRHVIEGVRAIMAEEASRAELHLTGVGVQKIDVADLVQRDQGVILPLVVTILVFVLSVIFRRPSGVLLPLLTTVISLIWTLGLYVLCGFELNTITALLPPVVMVLAVSNSIHLYNGWLHLEGDDSQRIEHLVCKVRELFTPCLFTALTTSFGLISLTVSSVPAVQHFALFAAIGVMISLFISLTLVPVGLSYLPLPPPMYRTGTGLLRWSLDRISQATVHAPRSIVLVALLLLIGALFGLPRLQNNTDMVGFLRDDAPLARDTRFIDRHLAGVNALEYMISRKDGLPLESADDYAQIAAFEDVAENRASVAKTFSILTLLRPLHRAETDESWATAPPDPDQLRYELDLLAMAPDQSLQRRFLSADRTTARISVWLHDVGSRKALALVDRLDAAGRSIFSADYRVVPTGSFYMMTQDSNRLVSDTLKSFALSLTLIVLSILVLIRSVRLTLLAMIPNVIPILWTFGLMGYCGIDLSTGTAMIGAVAIGLAVDDTIHYLVHYQRVYSGDARAAVLLTTTRIGRALMIATLVLALGFWAGCLGSFKPTIYFSFLVGGTLLGALACDLLVLPACLILGSKARREVVA
jgi:uncharacterized protein